MYTFYFPLAFYIFLVVFGFFLTIIKEIFELDILGVSHVSVSLSTAIVMWGVVGFFGIPEPLTFLIGFFGFGTMTYVIFSQLVISIDRQKEYIGLTGSVNMQIDPGKKGKVKIKTPKGNEFFAASTAEETLKPLKVGTEIQVVKFEASILVVEPLETPDSKIQKPSKTRLGLFGALIVYFKKLNKKVTGVCGFCLLTIEKRMNYSECKYCRSQFHTNHLKEWLETSSNCPNCKQFIKA